ncbi:MAG: thiamine phosphate synthase [Pseudomonadota bacterium]
MNNKTHKMEIFRNAGLYLVTSSELSNYPTPEVIEKYLKAGGKLFQLREKTMQENQFYETGLAAKRLSDTYGAVFIINDNVEMAKRLNADGVHLGQDDMSVVEARKILGGDFIIGVSTHNTEEAVQAQKDGADYINIGPVFPTATKPHMQTLGITGVEKILPSVDIPFTFMGGIKESNIHLLKKLHPAALAMVTEITKSPDVFSKVKSLLQAAF